jgi:hypothetical protein
MNVMFFADADGFALVRIAFNAEPVPAVVVVTFLLLVVVSFTDCRGNARRSASVKDNGVVTLPFTVGATGTGVGVAVGAAVDATVVVGDVQPDSASATSKTISIVIIAGNFIDFINNTL